MNQMKVYGETPVFGLDIGTRSVVGTVGFKREDRFTVIAQEIREHQTRAMLDGQIHDINRVADTILEIKKALEQQTGLELQEVCIAAAGRVLKTTNIHVDLEFDKERSITKDDISTVTSMGVEKAFEFFQKENDSDMRFYCVGYSVVKYYLNNMWMGQPEHHKAKILSADMIATFLPDDVVDGLYSAVELAGLKVSNLTLEPIAAIRVAIPEKFRMLNIAMIDVGAGTSDISITNDGSVIAYGMIPCAGDSLTEVLAKKCLVDFTTAEHIKTAISTQKEVTYEDIMGLEQTITADEILEICRPQIENMAKLASDEIRALNGGMSPSAVFIVGGGGRIRGFSEQIAKELGLDAKRVALRGSEIMKEIDFPEGSKADSTTITPVGICLSYYEQNNNFVYVTFNGIKVKLYDNNHLAVVDAAMQASFSKDSLFPRRGQELHYTVNGKARVTKGEYGENAKIYVNGEEVDLNYAIKANDVIVMEPATVGQAASMQVKDLVDYHAKLHVKIDGEDVNLQKPIKVNGVIQTPDYFIQEGDNIALYAYYSCSQLMDYLHVTSKEVSLIINSELAGIDAAIYSGDEIHTMEKELADKEGQPLEDFYNTPEDKTTKENKTSNEDKAEMKETVNVFKNMIEEAAQEEKEEQKKILVVVNQKPISLEGKNHYMFVDIFDYINFDTTRMRGKGIVTLVNGNNAQYTQELKNGDKIEVFWK